MDTEHDEFQPAQRSLDYRAGRGSQQPGRSSARAMNISSSSAGERATNYVLIPRFTQLTGYSEKAVRRKIESGVWLEGLHFRRAPDGHVVMILEGYERWVEQGRA